MRTGRISKVALTGALLFLFAGSSPAERGPGDIECLPEGDSLIYGEGDDLVSERRYTVPRKQVLMENATATW